MWTIAVSGRNGILSWDSGAKEMWQVVLAM